MSNASEPELLAAEDNVMSVRDILDPSVVEDRGLSVRDLLDLLKKKASQSGADELSFFETAFNEKELTACGVDINAVELSRLDAAILLHKYLLEIEDKPDLEDISGAAVLKDLYDCSKCVNHIAQVYLRGLIKPVRYPLPDGKEILLFDGMGGMRSADLFMS